MSTRANTLLVSAMRIPVNPWDQFVFNQRQLAQNRWPVRGLGGGLLSGLVNCGRCGQGMTVSYRDGGDTGLRYTCRGRRDYGGAICQSLSSTPLERFAGSAVSPAKGAMVRQWMETVIAWSKHLMRGLHRKGQNYATHNDSLASVGAAMHFRRPTGMPRSIVNGLLPFLWCLLAAGQTAIAQTGSQPEHALPLVRSASHPVQQGFVRIINRSNRSGTVLLRAIDDSGRRFDPISLSLGARETAHFNSEDLERGNASKGLHSGVGTGHGDWRLELDTELDIEALAYSRTSDGFVTSMHDVVQQGGVACSPAGAHVVIFNPGSNHSQRSWLRLINPSEVEVDVTIRGQDDAGNPPPVGEVRLRIPAGAARSVTAQALEAGDAGLVGRFGDGRGKWQLFITADGALQVMNLLQSPNGNLTNLSTTPRGTEAPGEPRTSYELQSSVLRTDWRAFLSLEDEKTAGPVAYGDFDCDGDEDVFVTAYDDSTWSNDDGRPVRSTAVQIYANDGDDGFTLATGRFITGTIPEMVFPRKALTGDFNRDGKLDIFVGDTGSEVPPFPSKHSVLLLSSENGLRSVSEFVQVDGYHHGAASGDIDHDGDLDIFITDIHQPVFLENDGSGNFVRNLSALPTDLRQRLIFTTEIIDVDEDGYSDLLVAGHESDDQSTLEAQPTTIYWGDGSGRYDSVRKTTLPAVAGQEVVVDIDAEDMDNDGDRDIVLTRTGSPPNFYKGHYIQIVANHGSRRFADETLARISGGASATARWLIWVRLEDVNGDGHPDIWIDDITSWGRTWINDGSGHFTLLN